ncbi:hypothetical protein F6R98_04475 [Candidatus Methylospira mobilis]|uniref:Uncharacterized protein n=1 Tax=Candidatus Methylospira mobilis TaxID=1808979 RepID=A0A5Q0BJJ5_9GAMM|nr:hypothetical protein [Candidatus Methylospira mobilis]QFY41976.1 hypothetical protein F6R98_04475 [Candidatus Methylospira mobilis]WNV02965.1 hypothetical protein RP726_10820 [Candidatus Methylospira mobilis]
MNPKLTLVLAAALLAAGCAEPRTMVVECKFPTQYMPDGPALVAQEYGEMSPIPLDAVQFNNPLLKERLVVQTLKASRTPTNTVQVSARIVNCTDAPLVLGLRSHFMGEDAVENEPESVWRKLIIQPRALGNYKESSLTADVNNYLIEIRDAY